MAPSALHQMMVTADSQLREASERWPCKNEFGIMSHNGRSYSPRFGKNIELRNSIWEEKCGIKQKMKQDIWDSESKK
jgi:hypothetical protein